MRFALADLAAVDRAVTLWVLVVTHAPLCEETSDAILLLLLVLLVLLLLLLPPC